MDNESAANDHRDHGQDHSEKERNRYPMNQATAEGGKAELHDRTGLLVAILALAVSVAALVFAVTCNQSSRDRDASLKDDVIRIDGDVKLMQHGK